MLCEKHKVIVIKYWYLILTKNICDCNQIHKALVVIHNVSDGSCFLAA